MSQILCHPAAELFPLMSESEFQGFKTDIEAHGVQDPVVMINGQVLDGRNRLRACRELNIKAPTTELDPNVDPWEFVISHNLHRRHLSDNQRASIAAKLATRGIGSNQHSEGGPNGPPSTRQAAKMLNVSTNAVKRAKAVDKHGSDELKEAVEKGEVPVSRAAQVAKSAIPKDKQLEAAKRKPSAGSTRTINASGQDEPKKKISGGINFNVDEFKDSEPAPEPDPIHQAAAIKEACSAFRRELNRLAKNFRSEMFDSQLGVYFLGAEQDFENRLTSLVNFIKVGEPYCVCYRCGGSKCDDCRGSGWMSKMQAQKFEQPTDIQKI